MMSLANDIIYGKLPEVARQLDQGADVNELDEYGYTPLIESAIANHTNSAELLIQHGAKINAQDVTGNMALHWAAENNNLDLCRLLLDNNADPNAYTRYGQPALIIPILRNQYDLKKLLSKYGADMNFAQDYINAKLLGHRFELRGRVDIVAADGKFIEVDLEGFIIEFTVAMLQNSLANFRKHFAARNLRKQFKKIKRAIKAYNIAADLVKYQQYLTDIKQHKKKIDKLFKNDLLLFPIGYEGHAISFIKYGNLFAKCDRGEASRHGPSVVIYRANNAHLLSHQLYYNLMYEKKDKYFVTKGIFDLLGLEPITELPLPSQLTGNCSWANIEAALPTMLVMLNMVDDKITTEAELGDLKNTALDTFSQWHEWDKDIALDHCINSFDDADKNRRMAKVALLALVLFQTCNYTNPEDEARTKKILGLLNRPEYQYILKIYLNVYGKTKSGENLQHLIDIFGH